MCTLAVYYTSYIWIIMIILWFDQSQFSSGGLYDRQKFILIYFTQHEVLRHPELHILLSRQTAVV